MLNFDDVIKIKCTRKVLPNTIYTIIHNYNKEYFLKDTYLFYIDKMGVGLTHDI